MNSGHLYGNLLGSQIQSHNNNTCYANTVATHNQSVDKEYHQACGSDLQATVYGQTHSPLGGLLGSEKAKVPDLGAGLTAVTNAVFDESTVPKPGSESIIAHSATDRAPAPVSGTPCSCIVSSKVGTYKISSESQWQYPCRLFGCSFAVAYGYGYGLEYRVTIRRAKEQVFRHEEAHFRHNGQFFCIKPLFLLRETLVRPHATLHQQALQESKNQIPLP